MTIVDALNKAIADAEKAGDKETAERFRVSLQRTQAALRDAEKAKVKYETRELELRKQEIVT